VSRLIKKSSFFFSFLEKSTAIMPLELDEDAVQLADLHDECSICFCPLSEDTVCQLMEGGGGRHRPQKACQHLFHETCIKDWQGTGKHSCPNCRKDFSSLAPVPKPSLDPRAWFDFIDENKDGGLSYDEILNGLKAQVNLDWHQIETDVDRLFSRWDKDNNGTISLNEFADPHSGVLAYLMKNYPSNPRSPPPDLVKFPREWFSYWDEDKSGSLSKAEVVRALAKSFRMYHMRQEDVRAIVDAIWDIFDDDRSGMISQGEFLREDGLGETITAAMVHDRQQRK
jgi:Ca2+-binding EF-hand superfamily protein